MTYSPVLFYIRYFRTSYISPEAAVARVRKQACHALGHLNDGEEGDQREFHRQHNRADAFGQLHLTPFRRIVLLHEEDIHKSVDEERASQHQVPCLEVLRDDP